MAKLKTSERLAYTMVFVLYNLPVPRSCFGGESKCLSWWKIKAYTGAGQGWLPQQESCRDPFFSVLGLCSVGLWQRPRRTALLASILDSQDTWLSGSQSIRRGCVAWGQPWSFLGLIFSV